MFCSIAQLCCNLYLCLTLFSSSCKVYQSNLSLLIQLCLVNGDYINLLADKSGFHEMQYVYGFSNKELLSIASNLKTGHYKLQNIVRLKGSITEWTQTKLILQPLIKPMFKRNRF